MQNVDGGGGEWGTIVWSVVKFRLQINSFRAVPGNPKRHAIPHSETHSLTRTHSHIHTLTHTHIGTIVYTFRLSRRH
jgi:hypothetical protein